MLDDNVFTTEVQPRLSKYCLVQKGLHLFWLCNYHPVGFKDYSLWELVKFLGLAYASSFSIFGGDKFTVKLYQQVPNDRDAQNDE